MFTFGFSSSDSTQKKVGDTSAVLDLDWSPSKEVLTTPKESSKAVIQEKSTDFVVNDFPIRLLSTEDVLKSLPKESNCINEAESLHSDLVPAKYEGGLKIWECTEDMIKYLTTENYLEKIQNKTILDLGCGAGVLGIIALQHNASEVHFQDYNEEVLQYLTCNNVMINNPEKQNLCRYFSGDWKSFAELQIENFKNKYDIILTSETIYNPDCHEKLLEVFKNKLAENGIILLAAKSYYFGVGGGTRQFENALDNEGTFKSQVVWKCPQGVQREILKITRKLQTAM